jgi:phage terminase Nu1 subunit (DNA packaging protein)
MEEIQNILILIKRDLDLIKEEIASLRSDNNRFSQTLDARINKYIIDAKEEIVKKLPKTSNW